MQAAEILPFENDESVLKDQDVGVDVDKLNLDILNNPKKLYSLIYGSNFLVLLESTNHLIEIENSKFPDPKNAISKLTETELYKYFATRILFMLFRGKHVQFSIIYEMFRSKEMNIFRVIGKNMNNISFLSRHRWELIHKYLHYGEPTEYINMLAWKKSQAKNNPAGGFFEVIRSKTNPEKFEKLFLSRCDNKNCARG